ncbi:hypothetical protein FOZ63_007426 [Perkinsus olseni]|uniref:TerD domain-containing protein n=1 Tax=Perkinsus olseni TaxID=32597 RepID=A0A7J6QT81_PEROL|nr:hypothetical protein FOZ63_007426 [Perkinsus olseni]
MSIPLSPNSTYSVGVLWDFVGGQSIDVDIQAIAVDNRGVIVDCAYYNNLKALGKALVHSGDELDGRTDGVDEKVTLNLAKMPQNVPLIVVAVFCYTGGSLGQVKSGTVVVTDETSRTPVFQTVVNQYGKFRALIVGAFARSYAGGFAFDALSDPCDGQHFMDVLPSLTQVVRRYIPSAAASGQNAVCAVNFQMQKGNVFDFGRNTQQIVCGLGWDTTFGQVDLDVSCVLMDKSGEVLETVFFGNLRSERRHSAVGAVVHTGDNLTGEGSGDDEQVILHMDQFGPSVYNIFFVINIYTRGVTFAQVANPYCRVVDASTGAELCRYRLNDAGQQNALVIARLARNPTGNFGFHALGVSSTGTIWKDTVPDLQRLVQTPTGQFLGSQMTLNFAGAPPSHGAAGNPQVSS